MRTLISQMTNQFNPNCKPYSLNLNRVNAILFFGGPCISGEELKNISLRAIPDAPVKKVWKGDVIIWPTTLK